jgi:hypothetical protein
VTARAADRGADDEENEETAEHASRDG